MVVAEATRPSLNESFRFDGSPRDAYAPVQFRRPATLRTRRGEGRISADHTGAPESLRGTGAAAALVRHMVEDARANGFRILPLCPYVRAQYKRNPDWADVMTLRPGEEP